MPDIIIKSQIRYSTAPALRLTTVTVQGLDADAFTDLAITTGHAFGGNRILEKMADKISSLIDQLEQSCTQSYLNSIEPGEPMKFVTSSHCCILASALSASAAE